jgi:hypothetical protein
MISRLGLRAGEVAGLHLDDIDWHHGRVTVQGKGGRVLRLPLPADVGEALVTYLRNGPSYATSSPPGSWTTCISSRSRSCSAAASASGTAWRPSRMPTTSKPCPPPAASPTSRSRARSPRERRHRTASRCRAAVIDERAFADLLGQGCPRESSPTFVHLDKIAGLGHHSRWLESAMPSPIAAHDTAASTGTVRGGKRHLRVGPGPSPAARLPVRCRSVSGRLETWPRRISDSGSDDEY